MQTQLNTSYSTINTLRSQLKDQSKAIDELDEKIKAAEQRRSDIIQQEKDKSPLTRLFNIQNSLRAELNELLSENRRVMESINEIRPRVEEQLSRCKEEKSKIGIRSLADLEKREKELQMRIIGVNLSSQQEKKISNELLEIRKKKKIFAQLEEGDKKIVEDRQKMDELRAEQREIYARLGEKRGELSKLDMEIDQMKKKQSRPPKELADLDEELRGLRKTKGEMLSKKAEIRKDLIQVEGQMRRFNEAMEEHKANEERKRTLNRKIGEIQVQIQDLSGQRKSVDPRKFDSITGILKRMNGEGKSFSLSPFIVQALCELGVPIPKTQGEVGECLEAIERSKAKYASGVMDRLHDIKNERERLERAVMDIRKQISEIPDVDVRSLKKKFGLPTN